MIGAPDSISINTQESHTSNSSEVGNNDTLADYFMHQKSYIPGQKLNTAVKTIYLAINIWQKEDGSGNFSESERTIGRMYYIVEHLNNLFARSADPVNPIEGIDYLKDSHIRFELKDVSFYQDSALYGVNCGQGKKLNDYVFNRSPHKRQYFNIHFNTGRCMGASGYANYPSGRDLETDAYVVSYIKFGQGGEKEYPFWSLMLHLAHEIGHTLELKHPYDSEYCRFSHPDFLFDLFGYERQAWCNNPRANCDICYQQGGFECDLEDSTNTCTNNLMGGNKNNSSITPLQMGRMNRTLGLKSTRKYAWGYSDVAYEVENDQHWAFNIKLYQDIRVLSGSSLHVSGTLEMVPQAKIILEPGAKLIVDAGRITNALYSNDPWLGVVIEEPPKKFFSFLRKKVSSGEIIAINNGKIENYIGY